MSVTWAYPWNAPRSAISCPGLTHAELHRRNHHIAAVLQARKALALQPECVRVSLTLAADALEKEQGTARTEAFLLHFHQRLLPRLKVVAQRYQLSNLHPQVSKAVFNGHFDTVIHHGLADRLVSLFTRYNQLPDMSKAQTERLAADIANFIRGELAEHDDASASELKTLHRWYLHAGTIALQFNVTPPHWQRVTQKVARAEDMAPAIMRLFNEQWWRGHLRKTAAQWREHLHIALGNVSKKKQPYASAQCVTAWREQKRRNREFLKSMELEDEEGNRISLIDKHDGSVANPAIRRCELMTRMRGFETICESLGYVGEFYTLTAPSAWHATTRAGYRNRKWNGASPAQTQAYFTRLWARIRAKLHRNGLRVFGIRVAEPHHDATPHWHLLLFMQPQEAARIREILRDFACQEDNAELSSAKAQRARFHAEPLDAKKGSATGYMAKYIAKNIDGYALEGEIDFDSGALLKESACAVSAWATRWHIRQFQFVGGAPVTVYRELRKLVDSELAQGLSVEFAQVHNAADNGDWAGYVNTQGGPFVTRDAVQVRTLYEADGDMNQYGEEILRVRGVYDSTVGSGSPLLTRLKKWKIVPKRAQEASPNAALSWSSVNNCTPFDPDQRLNRRQRRQLTHRLRNDILQTRKGMKKTCIFTHKNIRALAGNTWEEPLAERDNGFLNQQHSDGPK
ncbi:replication endonuclease [Enterobacter sp. Bisph1]|uniref:replication endonuclease n=1 Tax=Enterobacter sp. Bisph1 TaxID=1274399 RepID=UPI00057BDF3F|nr:replication endonuclease [Enterobacter sp. Bisph1]